MGAWPQLQNKRREVPYQCAQNRKVCRTIYNCMLELVAPRSFVGVNSKCILSELSDTCGEVSLVLPLLGAGGTN